MLASSLLGNDRGVEYAGDAYRHGELIGSSVCRPHFLDAGITSWASVFDSNSTALRTPCDRTNATLLWYVATYGVNHGQAIIQYYAGDRDRGVPTLYLSSHSGRVPRRIDWPLGIGSFDNTERLPARLGVRVGYCPRNLPMGINYCRYRAAVYRLDRGGIPTRDS